VPDLPSSSQRPLTQRVKHELRRRELTVTEVQPLTPSMVRIVLSGDDLQGFISASPDDHVKLFFEEPGGEVMMRDFTPRIHDAAAGTLAIDFVLHEGGPAGNFAASAKPGDQLKIGGPRGSLVVSDRVKRWLLVGDETALPAIARRMAEFGTDVQASVIIAVQGRAEEQALPTAATVQVDWVHRPVTWADDPTPVVDALKRFNLAPETFAWVGAEAKVAKAVRRHLLEDRAHPREWMKAAGYWVIGEPGAHQPLDD